MQLIFQNKIRESDEVVIEERDRDMSANYSDTDNILKKNKSTPVQHHTLSLDSFKRRSF